MEGTIFLSDEELAASRWLIGQCLEVRRASATALREALLVEDRAVASLEENLAQLEPCLWDALGENSKRLQSELRRRDLAEGRVLFPVTVYRMDPFTVGGN